MALETLAALVKTAEGTRQRCDASSCALAPLRGRREERFWYAESRHIFKRCRTRRRVDLGPSPIPIPTSESCEVDLCSDIQNRMLKLLADVAREQAA